MTSSHRSIQRHNLCRFFRAIIVCILSISMCVDTAFAAPESKPTQIVLITIDTLRSDVLSCYAPENNPTPNMDQIANQGVIFKNAVSPSSWTLPAMSAMMTGISPMPHLLKRKRAALSNQYYTLAEALQNRGFYTTAFVESPFLRKQYNFHQGFHEYKIHRKKRLKKNAPERLTQKPSSPHFITHNATRWLRDHQTESFFLWLHFFDPHYPYTPPIEELPYDPPEGMTHSFHDIKSVREGRMELNEEQKEWIRELYLAEVRYTDKLIGRVIKRMRELGIYNNAIVVLSSDHGEAFWEHGKLGHGYSHFEEEIRVPLIMKMSGQRLRRPVDHRVSTHAIMPTILNAIGIDYPRHPVMARPLNKLFQFREGRVLRQDPTHHFAIFFGKNRNTIVDQDYKYVLHVKEDVEELYNLSTDPAEMKRLEKESQDIVTRLKRKLTAKNEEVLEYQRANDIKVIDVKLNKRNKERLRSLGYIQ